jgi:predicted GTPase
MEMFKETNREENWEKLFDEMAQEFKRFNEEFERNFIKPNIILSGKTGVGKSTLVNAIFGSDIAMVGKGKPVSQALDKYSDPLLPVNLFDTKGIELGADEREASRISIVNEIKRCANSADVEDHMHVMWYCISNESRRIEDVELNWIKDFSIYMPVIIVLTQTLDNDIDFQKEIEKECPDATVCRVLAQDRELFQGVKIPQHGLKNLIDETLKIIPDATKRAFSAAQKIKIEEKIEEAKRFLQERLDSKNKFNYKNLAHAAEALPIGLDVLGKGAVYLYIAKDIMTVMGIPVTKNFLKFSKEARPLLKSIVLPFVLSEGARTAVKYGERQVGQKIIIFVAELLGKTAGKSNFVLSPIIGFILGAFNRKVTEQIANAFIEVCADFLRHTIDYSELSNEEIMEILSKNMAAKMEDLKESLEDIVTDESMATN